MTDDTKRFISEASAILAGYMQGHCYGSRFTPIDCRTLGDQRLAFDLGYEAAISGEDCPDYVTRSASAQLIEGIIP